MVTTIKPCPFCTSEDIDPTGGLAQNADGRQYEFPVCNCCGASAPHIEIWNSRPELTTVKCEGYLSWRPHKVYGPKYDLEYFQNDITDGDRAEGFVSIPVHSVLPRSPDDPVTVGQLMCILGDDELPLTATTIQVCEGDWVKRDDGLWGFVKNPEMAEDYDVGPGEHQVVVDAINGVNDEE